MHDTKIFIKNFNGVIIVLFYTYIVTIFVLLTLLLVILPGPMAKCSGENLW